MVPKTAIWTVWAAQVAKCFKMVPKATIWIVWVARMLQNGTKSNHLDRLGGPGGEMI